MDELRISRQDESDVSSESCGSFEFNYNVLLLNENLSIIPENLEEERHDNKGWSIQ